MALSITGGRFKGAVLRTPSGKDLTRPTSGKVRQALFNILRERIEDSDFLDLFAGSGAVGLEALSRGCRRAILVENHPLALQSLKANFQMLISRGAESETLECVREDAFKFCRNAVDQNLRFGVVFCDPPFTRDFSGLWEQIQPLLNPEGVGVVQFPTRNPPDFGENVMRTYVYGESSLAVFDAAHC